VRVPDLLRRRRSLSRPRDRQFRYVFVVTYGRSGSTLVQGLLNAIPRVLVRGENNLYLLPLFRAYREATTFRKGHAKHNPHEPQSAFYGVHEVRPRSFVRYTRDLMMTNLLGRVPARDVDVIGFKEVRWHRIWAAETEAFFEFLDQVFPEALYVLNTRQHEQVAGSGFWLDEGPDTIVDAIIRVEQIQEFLRQTRPERVFDTHYEVLTSPDPAVADAQLRGLADFVSGTSSEELMVALRNTMRKPHGPRPFGASIDRRGPGVG
jgi:hypothetical protein